MSLQHCFHAPDGADFLGWRVTKGGEAQIVHEDAHHHRHIWRLARGFREESLVEALSLAVTARRVVPHLMDELKKRAIEAVPLIG